MTCTAARICRMILSGSIVLAEVGALLGTPGCHSQDARINERQSGQGSNSCQLVQSGNGPTGIDPVHLETVANSLQTPWSLAFLPKGDTGSDILVTERPGRLRVIKNGALVPKSVLEVNVVQSGEGGLLGLALHPDFADNSLFYIYETALVNGSPVNRVERYRLSSDHLSATLDRVIIDNILAGSVHDGGRIHFGPDGMLYIATGNAGNTDLSQDANSLNGKVLRLTAEGGVPADNPEPGKAWFLNGIRNAEGFDWIDSQTMIVADNGPTGEYQGRLGGDEVSVAHAGENLGWPTIWHCETQPGLLTPILSWNDAVPPGGLTIYRGNQIPGWTGNVFIGTLGSEHLHRIVLDANHNVSKHEVYFEGQVGRIREVVTGPDGALYITTSNCDSRGNCPSGGDSILKVVPGAQTALHRAQTQDREVASNDSPVFVQGTLNNRTGAPIQSKKADLQFTLSGLTLFDSAENSCPGDPHMQGVSTDSITTGNQGDFAAQLSLNKITSRVNESCTLQKNLNELDSLTVSASIDTDTDTCSGYCKSVSDPPDPSCVSKCLTGQRKLQGTKNFSHAELAGLNVASTNGQTVLNSPITLNELGPALSTLHGPDLVVDGSAAQTTAQVSTETFAADDCAVVEGCIAGPGQHKLLRFDGVIQNLGDADFILGNPENNPLFVYSSCHQHYHLQDIMLYELLDSATKKPVLVNGSAVVGRKQGFCMIDNDQVAGNTDGKYDCDLQGISPGWSDNYDHTLDCQWIDVTGVPAGNYTLRITVNPVGRYSESNSSNNSVEVPVVI